MTRLDLSLFLLLVLCGLAVVNSQHRARRLFVDLQREYSVGEQLASDLRRLQSDQATLAAANRVERAATLLRMHQPLPARSVAMNAVPVVAAVEMPVPVPGQTLALKLARGVQQ